MKFKYLLLVLLLFSSQIMADDKGLIIRTSKIYKNASSSSAVVGQIKSGTKVDIIESKSGWKQIFFVKKSLTGWIRSYQVRTGFSAEAENTKKDSGSGGFLFGLASISRSVTSLFKSDKNAKASSTTTATIGVRGLSEAELKTVKPDLNELKKMKLYVSSVNRVDVFVRKGQLTARKVKALK